MHDDLNCGECECKFRPFSQEGYMVADRKPMHKRCLKCDRCHKMLTPANLNTMVEEAKIFCQNCYNDAVMASLVELLFSKRSSINSTHLKGGARNPVPEKVKMQVLPIEGMFKVVSF